MADPAWRAGGAALRSREFRFLIAARFLWNLGQQVFSIAVSLLVFERTRDPLALGLIGLAAFVPALCLTLVSGPVADHVDRRLVSLLCFAAMAATALAIVIAGPGIELFWLYASVVASGATRAFANPATSAMLPNVVPRDQLASALAWNNSLSQTANIGGPMVGAFLYAAGAVIPFACCAGLFVIAALFALRMQARPPQPGGRVSWEMIGAGYHYIWTRPVVFGAITLDLIAVVLGGATALLPVYALDIFHAGPEAVGVLRAANSVGALAAAIVLAVRPLGGRTGRLMFACVMIFGLATIGFGLSTTMASALFFLFVLGVADQISVVIRQMLVQIQTPDAMRGRVSAVFSIITGASNQLGQFESGALAALVGVVGSVVIGGVGAVVSAMLWMKWFPSLRDYDRLDEPPDKDQ